LGKGGYGLDGWGDFPKVFFAFGGKVGGWWFLRLFDDGVGFYMINIISFINE
jgi:hypothetical protein